MALQNCPECNNQISDKATACPKCGAPVEKVNEARSTQAPKQTYTTPPQQEEEKKSPVRRFIFIGGAVLAILAIIAFLNNPNSIPGISIKINTPKPTVATARADDADASVFNFKETVYTTVSNQGGDGKVLINFRLTQAGKTFTKTMSIFMRAGQNMDLKQVFDEVTRLGGKMEYSVDASAQ